MSKSKILWIITGTLAGALVAVSGYLFLGREEIDPNVTQMPAQVGENKFEEQVVKNDITKPREVSLDLISPNGGESFDISKSITIRYKLSDSFKKQLSPLDKVELYLVDSKNVLIGYIGEVNKTAGEFNWNTQKLFRNGGLDFSVKQTPAGQYRILLVARKERDASDVVAKDTGISTIDGFIYSNGKIIQSGANEVWREQPIVSDISTSVFTLINNVVITPKPTVNVSGGTDTFSQFKDIISWTTTEDSVIWKNYYTFSQKINDALRMYPNGQMITLSKTFNPNSIEQKNTIDAVFASLAQNNWKRITDSYATDLVRFDQYLYEKNSKPLILTIEKTQFEKEQMIVQIQFLK